MYSHNPFSLSLLDFLLTARALVLNLDQVRAVLQSNNEWKVARKGKG